MSKYYLKFRHDAVKDPKLMRLPDRHFRRFMECLCLAGELDQDGLLPPIDDMAWILHLEPAALIEDLQALSLTGMVRETPDGWLVTNFAKHQAAETGAERVARYRETKRTGNEPVTNRYAPVTDDVTNTVPELELKIESESELKLEAAAQAAAPEPPTTIVQLYTDTIGPPTQAIHTKLANLAAQYPAESIQRAFAEAAEYNGRSLAYVEAILKRWQKTGSDSKSRKNGNGRDPQRYAEWSEPPGDDDPARQFYARLLDQLHPDKSVRHQLELAMPQLTDHTLQLIATDPQHAEYIRQRAGPSLQRILYGFGDYQLTISTQAVSP